jgi:hypothetical protein
VAGRCRCEEVDEGELQRSVVHHEDARQGRAPSRSLSKPITQTPG